MIRRFNQVILPSSSTSASAVAGLTATSALSLSSKNHQGNFYNMKSTGKKTERTTTSSFDGTSNEARAKADEKMTEHDNFFKRRDAETEQAARDPRSFRQDQGRALNWAGHASNVFAVIFGSSLIISVGIFQYINAGFGTGWEAIFGSKRKNYWTKRNEAVDTKLHQHSSFNDMLGFKKTNVTNSGDDEILAKAKAFKAAKEAEKKLQQQQQEASA